MRGSLLKSYEGQVKVFLVLLVLFLAVAIYFNVHLLVLARNAIQEETSRRLALEADLVRAELERDQMLRGLQAAPDTPPYIPPTFLDRMARVKGMMAIAVLTPEGRVVSSSDPARVGQVDAFLVREGGVRLRRLANGGSVIAPLDRPPRSDFATLRAYRPIQDKSHVTVALIEVEESVPALASVDLNLRTIASLQAGGLVFVLALVIVFARWLLQPYRKLLRAAGEAPGALAGLAERGGRDEPDYLVAAFQGVVDKLRDQEQELQGLKQRPGTAEASSLPGEHLIRGMTSAVLVFDRDGRLSVLNPAAERLLGLPAASARGRKYGDLLGGNWKLVDLVERSLRDGESHSREVVPLASPSGKVTHLGAMISPIRSAAEGPSGAGASEGALCLLADLTEIKSLREKVGLKENLAALGEMSAGIAHEFRNALATIQGLARLIARGESNGDGGGPAAAREHAETILREVGGIEKVVGDFLRFARPVHLDLEEVDLEGMTEDLVRDFRADPQNAGIAIDREGIFPRLVGDETLIRQALQNLLRNAAESFGSGDGAVGDGTRVAGPARPRITLRGAREEGPQGGARIVVEDNGPGIAAADLPRIFTPFFTTKDRGTGLGLALVQKTAVVHDGRVEVESREGEGARFSLVLPARPATAESPAPL